MCAAPLSMWKLNSSGSESSKLSWTGEKVDRGSWGYVGYSNPPGALPSQGFVLYGRSLGNDMIEDLPKGYLGTKDWYRVETLSLDGIRVSHKDDINNN